MQEDMFFDSGQIRQLSLSMKLLRQTNERLIKQNKKLLKENATLHAQCFCTYCKNHDETECLLSSENLRNLLSLCMIVSGFGIVSAYI
jgi:hypothetical protein